MAFHPKFSRGQLAVRDDILSQHEVRVFPGVRGRALQDIVIDESTIIPAGSSIIIQPLNADDKNETQSYKLTLFTRDDTSVNKDLPESQRDIIPGKSFTTTIDNSEKYFWFEEHYERHTQPLFGSDNRPSIADIRQGAIPDCFLLSAIQSILNHPDGSDFIRGMMKQNDDGTTTVRLFDPKTKQPAYIRVNTSVLADRDAQLNKHHALWVHVLELAYVEMGSREKEKTSVTNKTEHVEHVDASASSVFSGGGYMDVAISILTGLVNEKQIELPEPLTPPWIISDEEIGLMSPLLAIEDFPGRDRILQNNLTSKLDALLHTYEQNNPSDDARLSAYHDYMAYFNFYQANQAACDAIYQSGKSEPDQLMAMIDLAMSSPDPHGIDVANFFKLNLNYRAVPVEFATVRGETSAFSGFYSVQQNRIVNDIEQALENGQLVGVNTRAQFATDTPGIATGHVYTILKVVTREEKMVHPVTGIELIKPIQYVQLRNPWGHTGRVYQQIEGTLDFVPTSSETADIFEIEVTDFFKYYDYITISQSANTLFSYDKQRLQLTASIEQWLPSLSISTDTVLDQLVDFKMHYDEYTADLIQLEMQHLEGISPHILQAMAPIFSQKFPAEIEDKLISSLLLDHVSPAFFAGEMPSDDDFQVHHPLHDLLKLRFLQSQENPSVSEIDNLKAKIVQEAQYDFCSEMNQEKMKFDIMTTAQANVCRHELEVFQKNWKTLTDSLLKEQASPSLGVDCLKDTFQQLIGLQAQFVRISTMNASLSKLGVTIDAQALSTWHQQIEEIEATMKMQPRYDALAKDYQVSHAAFLAEIASAAHEGQLPDEYKKHLTMIANELNLNMKPTAQHKKIAHLLINLNTSISSKVGQKLEQLINISEKLCGLIKNIQFILGKFFLGERFVEKTQYEKTASVASQKRFRESIKDDRASTKDAPASIKGEQEVTQHYRAKMQRHRQNQASPDASQQKTPAVPSILKSS